MNSTLIPAAPKPEITYPCLFKKLNRPESETFYILATDNHTGTVVKAPRADFVYPVGYYSDEWVDFDSVDWEVFDGKVQLFND